MIDLEQEERILTLLQDMAQSADRLAKDCYHRFGSLDNGHLNNRGNFIGATANLLSKMLEREAADQSDRMSRYLMQANCDHTPSDCIEIRCTICHERRTQFPDGPNPFAPIPEATR